MLTKLAKPFHICRFARKFASSELSSAKATGVVKREKLQFSKKRLTDWGELPQGEIPDALQYDRPFGNFSFLKFSQKKRILLELSSLDNGVKVGTETWKSKLAT